MPSYAEVSGRYVPPRDLTEVYHDVVAPMSSPPAPRSSEPEGYVEPGLAERMRPYSPEHAALEAWRI